MPQRSKPLVRRAEPGDAQVLATLGRALNIQQGDSHAFFRTFATVEEPVIAFATFGDEFTRLADEGDSL